MNTIDKEKWEKQYIENTKEKIKLFIQKDLLKPIQQYQIVHNWTQQFPPNSLVPFFLLDTLIILTREQVEASLKNILEQIKASIFANNPTLSDVELFSLYDNHIEHSVFLSACAPGETAGGAPETLRIFRKIIGNKFKEIPVTKICKEINENGIKNIYVVDDFIGTGKTMSKFIKSEHFCEKCSCNQKLGKCSICCALKANPDINFTIISIVSHNKGIKYILDEHSKIKMLSAFTIDESYDLLSENCELYRDSNYIKETISSISEIMTEHQMNDNQYALHLPIAISEEFPNNSLELFWWAESSEWKPLIARQH